MADWTFEFIDSTSQKENEENLSSVVPDNIGSGANSKPTKKSSKQSKDTFSSTFTEKVQQDSIQQFIVSPLNTVTGGLASPLYASARQLARGATLGAVAGDLIATAGIMALQFGIQALQNRIQEIEQKVTELGNADNVRIRAGSVSTATYYSGNIFGITSKTNRS